MSAKFLVTTQAGYLQKNTRSKHICDARSHIAKRQHAIRHAIDDASASVEDQTRIRQPFPEPAQPIDPDATCIQDRQSQSSGSQSILGAEEDSIWDEEDEDLSLDDLIDIFPSILSEERRITTTAVQTERTSHAHDVRSTQKQALPPGPTSRELTLTVHTLSKGHGQANTPQKRASDGGASLPTIAQISSTLDPFIRLPIEISEQEKSLVHFYFNHGRRWIWGTSRDPQYCPAFNISQSELQVCPINVLTNVVLAESIYSRTTERPPRPYYYARRAQIYKRVSERLADKHAPFHRKMFAIMYLAVLEFTNGESEVQATHINALDQYVESEGGVANILSRIEDANMLYLGARFYSTQFLRSEVPIATLSQLKIIRVRFSSSLHRIQTWTSATRAQLSLIPSSRSELSHLINYLYHLIEVWLSDRHSKLFHIVSGAWFCSFSLAITLSEYSRSPTEAFDFLSRVQQCMRRSTEVSSEFGKELADLHPYAAAHIISYIRAQTFADLPETKQTELRINQTVVDAQKMFVLLSEASRIELVNFSLDCALPSSRQLGGGELVPLGKGKFQELEKEILTKWLTQRDTVLK